MIISIKYFDEDVEPDEDDIQHVNDMIAQGYSQGELIKYEGDNCCRGWWNLQK